MLHNQQHKWNVENQDNPNCIRDSACIYRFCCHASKIIKNSALIRLTILTVEFFHSFFNSHNYHRLP